jgi:hypothetical protein
MITLSEKELVQRLECPARSNSLASTSEDGSALLTCAEHTARWLSDELANGRQPTARETRYYFDGVWTQTAYFQMREKIPMKKYAATVMRGMRACYRLRDVFWRCEILQPVLPYELSVGGMVLTGEYAVLRSSRYKKHAFALYLRQGGVKKMPLVPDVVSFARWLKSNAFAEWGVDSIAVMHYWVGQYLQAKHLPYRQEAVDVLEGAAGVITGRAFPIPGPHCSGCGRPCRSDSVLNMEVD